MSTFWFIVQALVILGVSTLASFVGSILWTSKYDPETKMLVFRERPGWWRP